MANQLEITSKFDDSSWLITSKVSEDSDPGFPKDIFLWTLDDDGALDKFQAIGQIDQVAKYSLYNPTRTNNFGVHLVRYSSSTQRVSTEQDRDKVITVLKSAFTNLLKGYDEVTDPVIELYP